MDLEHDSTILSSMQHLLDLGYPPASIHQEVKISYGEVADIVVYEGDSARLVVEVKQGFKLPEEHNQNLRFNPLVRRLQATAHACRAPYYALSDGSVFLWFTTDSSGRPQAIAGPIGPSGKPTTNLSEARFVLNVFRQLMDHLAADGASHPQEALGIILLARLLRNREQPSLERELRAEATRTQLPNSLKAIGRGLPNRPALFDHAFTLLDRIHFASISPHSLLRGIDGILNTPRSGLIRIPRWLADLMVRLCNISANDTVVDLHSSVGDLSTAIALASPVERLRAYCPSETGLLWNYVQKYIVGQDPSELLMAEVPPYDAAKTFPPATRILTAAPFGKRLPGVEASSQFISSEAAYLQLAIEMLSPGGRAVILVPERLLISPSKREWRDFILKNASLVSVIALGTFSEFSLARGSLLVIDKKIVSKNEYVYFGSLNLSTEYSETFDSRTIPQVQNIINQIAANRINSTMLGASGCVVPIARLNSENLSATKFLTSIEDPRSGIPLVPLHTVASLFRGGATRRAVNDEGIPAIGPAAVRPMQIETQKMDSIDEKSIHPSFARAQVGDTLVNAIGTYRGSAAIVPHELNNILINRHIILVRSNTHTVLPEYLPIALNSEQVQSQLKIDAGKVIPALSLAELSACVVAIPPVSEQRKIVAELEEVHSSLLKAEADAREARRFWFSLVKHGGRKLQ